MITQNIFLLLSSGNLVIFLINECNSLMVQGNLPEIKEMASLIIIFLSISIM
jgi:hypothetical protein